MPEFKQHPPSKRRLEEAARSGRVVRSTLATQTVAIFGMFSGLLVSGSMPWVRNQILLQWDVNVGVVLPGMYLEGIENFVLCTIGIGLLFGTLACIIAELLQHGLRIRFGFLLPFSAGLSLSAVFGRILKGLRQLWFRLFSFLFLAVVLLWFSKLSLESIPASTGFIEADVLDLARRVISFPAMVAALILALLSAGDWALERRRYFSDLAMSREEVEREQRELDGEPHIKNERRFRHRELLISGISSRVKRARVIVVARS